MTSTHHNDQESARLKKINLSLLASFILVTTLGGLAFGLDFAKGALVGCSVVAINFYLSQYLIARLLSPGQAKAPVVIFYILKFGLSMALLGVSLVYFKVDIWGVILGLSTLFMISLFATFFNTKQTPEIHTNKQP